MTSQLVEATESRWVSLTSASLSYRIIGPKELMKMNLLVLL